MGCEVEVPAIESIRVVKVMAVTEEDLDEDFMRGEEGVLGYEEEWGTGEEGMKEVEELLRGLGVGREKGRKEQEEKEEGDEKRRGQVGKGKEEKEGSGAEEKREDGEGGDRR